MPTIPPTAIRVSPARGCAASCRRWRAEGLTAQRLALLAKRVRRAEAALASAVSKAAEQLSQWPWAEGTRIELEAAGFFRLPDEIGLRLLGRAWAMSGDEGPVELAKLETLHAALRARTARRFAAPAHARGRDGVL